MKPILTILNGDRAGERLLLESNKRYIVGRDQATDISLPEKKISRRHSCIYWESEIGRLVIEDLGSLNGTLVNGDLISGPKVLQTEDRIQIGSFILQIQMQEMSVTADDYQTNAEALEPLEAAEEIAVETTTAGRMIHGRLSEISLADLLQMLGNTRKTGLLVISNQKLPRPPSSNISVDTAFIYMNSGDVDFAVMNGIEGEEAFFEILRKTEGYFALFPLPQDASYQATITMPLEALLLEGFRRLDEEKARGTKISANDQFEVQPDEPLGSLSPEELSVFQLVWKFKKFSAIVENSQFEKEKTTTLVKKLMRSGFIKKIKKEKKS